MQKKELMPARIMIDEGLALQRVESDDAEDLFQIIQSAPEIKLNVTWPASVNSVEDTSESIKYLLKEDKFQPYALKENNSTIGYIGTWKPDNKQHEIGFSYFLDKNKRGRGYVTRALQRLMQVAKEKLQARMFVVNIIDTNEASKAIAAKLGFEATDKLLKDEVLKAMLRRYERPA